MRSTLLCEFLALTVYPDEILRFRVIQLSIVTFYS